MAYVDAAGTVHSFRSWDHGADVLTPSTDVHVGGTPVSTTAPFPTQDVSSRAITVTTVVTRPANTTQYVADEAFADTTPTAGGFTITNAARVSGGSGVIMDAAFIMSSDATVPLSAEIWLFDSAPTAIADNTAFTVTAVNAALLVGIIPFTTSNKNGSSAVAYVSNINLAYTCVGSANLRYLVRVKNNYTPGNAETLTSRFKIAYTS